MKKGCWEVGGGNVTAALSADASTNQLDIVRVLKKDRKL